MSPSRVRDSLARIQEELRSIEKDLEKPSVANVGYLPVRHELTEAWDALERAVEMLDEMSIGLI